ncbi:hypothetical protein G9A89_012975 [Geosiphon pyriformis]|nr:hypothetical protein G9A89_012975 [Geosiphon pyriformis]
MDLEAAFSSNMSKKKAPKSAFYGPIDGSFSQKKRVVLENVKHLGDEKDISLNRSELVDSVFSDVDSVSGDEESTNITSINVESLLDSATNTSKAKHVNTDNIFGSPLGSPNFVMDNDKDIEISVKKFFALNINLSAMEENLTMAKTQLIRKIFSSVNGFGRATTPLKFEGIIRSTFTSKKSINMAVSLARERGIIINTNLKKSGVCSDQTVVIKKILMDTPKKMIVTTVVEFGNIKSIKIQLIDIWQKAVIKFTESMHVAKAVRDRDIWASRDHFRAFLFTLPVGTTTHNLGTLLDRTGSKTCIINRSLDTGNKFCCAVIGFEFKKNLNLAFRTKPVFGDMQLLWTRLDLVWYGKCGHFGHSALECNASVGSMPLSSSVKSFKDFVSEERHLQLAKLYKKKEVSISCPVAFVVLVASPLSRGFLAGSSSNFLPFSYHNIGDVSFLNKHLASLEHSLELFSDQMFTIVRHLDSAELVPLVSSSFVSFPNAFASSASGLDSDMVLDGTSILFALSFSTVDVGVHVFSSSSSRILTSKVGGLESKLAFLKVFIGLVLAHLDDLCSSLVWKFAMCNVWGLNVPAKWTDVVCWHVSSGSMVSFVTKTKLRPSSGPWIKDKFEGVQIFTSGLDVGYLGAGVAVIMNNFLAYYVFKVEVVPGHVISVCLLFKNKLSVTMLSLYAGVSSGICFGQASEVNFLIAKAVNTSNFVVLGGDFNENGSRRSASFRFCLGFGLVNSFASYQLALAPTWYNLKGIEKTIDYILVSKSLSSAVAKHWVGSVLDFFDMDYSAVMVSVGLGGYLDVQLNSLHRQTNRDHWKFKIKNADISKNKHSLKFFGLELFIAKILGAVHSGDMLEIVCLIKKWSTLDENKACMFFNLVRLGKNSGVFLKYLFSFCKEYRKSKMFESKLAEETSVRKAIKKCMESFTSNKRGMIRSILDRFFCKVVLDHLVVNKDLVLKPGKVKSKVDKVMTGWTRKQVIPTVMPDLWAHQYASLDYV